MPRKPKEIDRPANRPLLDIDWNVVDNYLKKGCPGTKIADAIGVSANTLYDRCEQEKGVSFSQYSQQKKTNGDALLHVAQFDKALEGDTSLLIFLGKVRLDQREVTTIAVAPETEKNYRSLMEDVAEMQRNRQNVVSIKIEEQMNES